jgi:acetylornithine/succinyldiaminopimelate/putrescine aminotransferase
LLSAGTHASTFGGTPLACAVAERILDVVARDNLAANARRVGELLIDRLRLMQGKYPCIMSDVRGLGLMIGIEFEPKLPIFTNQEKSPAIQVVNRLHEKGVLTVPAATTVIRLLPPLNLSESEADEGLHAIKNVVEELNG